MLDVPHVTPRPDLRQSCIACLAEGPHGAIEVPGDAAPVDRDHFTYFACNDCGTLQIERVPADISRYYGGTYYSFREQTGTGGAKQALIAARNAYAATGRGLLGRALYAAWPYPQLAIIRPMMDGTIGRKRDANVRILDVGCGAGHLLKDLRLGGFTDLTGIDPYLAQPVDEPGFRLIRQEIASLTEHFDIITFNHSLEHVLDPCATLRSARGLLAPGGIISVRVPLVDSEAWRIYGGEWGQLDAPRHISLFTRTGMDLLATRAGLAVVGREDDSTENQFVLSELRLKGIRFHEVDVHAATARLIPADRLRSYRRRAATINAVGQGDQAAFFLHEAHPRQAG